MKLYSKIVLDMNKPLPGGLFEVIEAAYVEYVGPVAQCKVNDAEKSAAANLDSITTSLKQSFGENFAAQQSILKNLTDSIDSVIKAGPSQYGFSAQEDSALRSQALTGTGAAYRNAQQAVQGNLAAIGGGNTFLPSGTAEVIKAQVANQAADQEASQQLGITTAGWNTGRQNYLTALNEGNSVASILNPAQYSSQALQGSQASFDAQHAMATEPTTAGVVGGILGSVAGAAVGGLTGTGGLLAQKT